MQRDEILRTLGELSSNIFDREVSLTESSSAADIEGWDSLNHIKLIMAVEREFGIKFNSDEILGFLNVGDLINVISEKKKSKS